MKLRVLMPACLLGLGACFSEQDAGPQIRPEPWANLVPRAWEASVAEGVLALGSDMRITVAPGQPGALRTAEMLAAVLRASTGWAVPVEASEPDGTVHLALDSSLEDLGPEGYELTVGPDGVDIRGFDDAGLFYGTQTLRQLLPATVESAVVQKGPWALGNGTIRDRPRFAWRGLMIDVARHFFSTEDLRRYVDVMALYKMNRLHLHLTDDQGWRIQIDAWPALATVGGSTEVGGGEGGYYTKADYEAFVAYAQDRFVTIVPEVDMPGHTRAALASVPELNCDGQAPEPYTGTSVGISSLCIGTEETAAFVDGVIGEVAQLTPGSWIHVGGDEAQKTSDADYVAFMSMVQEVVRAHGKQMVGWDEIGRIDLETTTIAQHWANEDTAVAASEQGARVLMSPATRAYLDMKYDLWTPSGLGTFWAGFIDVSTAYDWDPGTWLSGVPESAVAGVEAAVWTETLDTVADLDVMIFPRLLGYAELGWSPWQGHDAAAYRVRLGAQGPRLTAKGIGFYRAPEVPWIE